MRYVAMVRFRTVALHLVFIFGTAYWFYIGRDAWSYLALYILSAIPGAISAVAYHRWLCHKQFEPSRIGEYVMWLSLILFSAHRPLQLVVAHRLHHRYTDKDGDPHSPLHLTAWQMYLGQYQTNKSPTSVKDFYRNPRAVFVNKYYWHLWWAINGLIAIIDLPTALILAPKIFVLAWLKAFTVNYLCHKDGVLRNLSLPLQIFTFGEGLHKNHHEQPTAWALDFDKGQFDIGKYFVMLLRTRTSQ